jgi:chromosome segregation ATPase
MAVKMAEIHEFPPKGRGGGSGPEDPMLERRVDTLEADMKDVKSSLSRIEVTLARIDGTVSQMPKASDFARLSSEIAEVDKRLSSQIAEVDKRLSSQIAEVKISLGGEIAELKGRVSTLPTVWTQLSIVFATWGIGSGILIFALTRLLAK